MKKILCLLVVVLCLVGCGQRTEGDKGIFKNTNRKVAMLKTGEEMNKYFKDAIKDVTKIVFDKYDENNYDFTWGEGEDVSQNGDMSIQLFKKTEKMGSSKDWMLEVRTIYILSKDVIYANTDSSKMFSECILVEVKFDNFDTSRVINMSDMFNYSSLGNIALSKFDTSKVIDMSNMFKHCQNLTSLDLSNFDTSNVVNMYGMFDYCSNLRSLDVSNFDTNNVTNMSRMFFNCWNLTNLDVSNFKTNNVTTMKEMFYDCNQLTSLDVSKFNTSKVTDMSNMFTNCYGLKKLDLNNFDTSNVINMSGMFSYCKNLEDLNISNFNMKNVVDKDRMFAGCELLKNIEEGENKSVTKAEHYDENIPFLMPVEDVFTITGKGTCVTGKIERGKIKLNDSVDIVGLNDKIKSTVVIGIEKFKKDVDTAEAGDNVSLIMKNIERSEIQTGQVLSKPKSIASATKFDAKVYILTEEEGGYEFSSFDNYEISRKFWFWTSDTEGNLQILSDIKKVNLGDTININIELEVPEAMEIGTEFKIRLDGRTVAKGTVTKIY